MEYISLFIHGAWYVLSMQVWIRSNQVSWYTEIKDDVLEVHEKETQEIPTTY